MQKHHTGTFERTLQCKQAWEGPLAQQHAIDVLGGACSLLQAALHLVLHMTWSGENQTLKACNLVHQSSDHNTCFLRVQVCNMQSTCKFEYADLA